jgi:thioredoxin-related protein
MSGKTSRRVRLKSYRIRTIPTLIFYDPQGKELTRRKGYMPKAAIMKVWREQCFTF